MFDPRTHIARANPSVSLDWDSIRTVLLDMDGTLLDLHYDNYFWRTFVPERYAEKHGLPVEEATRLLIDRFRREEGTLNWTDIDYWSAELGLDIPMLKEQVHHLIEVQPYVVPFLKFVRSRGILTVIVTDAHGKTLDIKMRKTEIGDYFDHIVSAHDLGARKYQAEFWKALREKFHYDGDSTLLVDDKEDVLASAQAYGIRHLIHVGKPSSREPHAPSERFRSIAYFNELFPHEG